MFATLFMVFCYIQMSSFLYYNDKNILCLNKIIVNKQTKKQKQEKKTKQTKRQKMKTIKTEKNEH